MSSQESDSIRETLMECRDRYKRGQVRWSIIHHTTVFGGPVLAFMTTLAVSIGWSQVWKSIFAAATTLLVSLGTAGAFREKWKLNRLSRSKVDRLLIELIDVDTADPEDVKVRTDLLSIIERHDEGILGAEEKGGE
jgi:hypothetical protein